MERIDEDRHLRAVHEDVIRAFERALTLLEGASDQVAGWTRNPRGVPAELRGLAQQLASVRELELVMPIVAPMKAGKSSLINAIVGYQLLPSRANPMTTLPTRIVIKDDQPLDKPELNLPESLVGLYAELDRRIRAAITAGRRVPEAHAYLEPLAKEIVSQLQRRYTGVHTAHSVPARLNDEVRLAAFVAPEFDVLAELEQLPELRTGSQHSYQVGATSGGTLVIVDTPGPNEHDLAIRLGGVIEDQLSTSHVVLIVLDYAQLGAEAAQDVRDQLARHLELIGPNLIGVVNKVDMRKDKSDLNEEDTRESTRVSLGLTPEQAADRIFETRAHWGVLGSRVLAELAAKPEGYRLAGSEAVRALWREKNPIDPEEDIELEVADTPDTVIERYARRTLERSGVMELVNDAIARLRDGTATW